MKKEKEVKEVEVIEEETKYPHKSLQVIEDTRSVFWKSYKLHNTFKMVVMMICLAAIIVAFIVFPSIFPKEKSGLQTGLTITIAVLALGGTYGYSLYVRKKGKNQPLRRNHCRFRCVILRNFLNG